MKEKNFCILSILACGILLGGCKNSQDSEVDLDIHTAAMFGNLEEVESILAQKPEFVHAKDEDGYTPLHLAISELGNKEVVKLLIEKGADINARDRDGYTPLHLVFAKLGNTELVKFLIDNGADVNAKGGTLGATPLHLAAEKGFKDIVELLILSGADINAKNNIGGTVLHHLTTDGQVDNVDMIEFLLAKGANINAKDNMTGGTPLHYASMNGYKNIVKFLIANRADTFCKALEDATPLMLAVNEGHQDVADLLRKHMKDISDLLRAISENGYDDKGVLVLTERLKKIAPEMNKILGSEFKQDYTFDWYSMQMLALKMAEQQFRALDMINDTDKVNKAVESLETAWLESDLHEILYANFYNIELETVLNEIYENMSEEEQQQISVDTVPVKALAERLLKQAEGQTKQ